MLIPDYYIRLARYNVQQALIKFGTFLDISNDVFILGKSFDMSDFHTKLEAMAISIRVRPSVRIMYPP